MLVDNVNTSDNTPVSSAPNPLPRPFCTRTIRLVAVALC